MPRQLFPIYIILIANNQFVSPGINLKLFSGLSIRMQNPDEIQDDNAHKLLKQRQR
jgi:hypothetical protein